MVDSRSHERVPTDVASFHRWEMLAWGLPDSDVKNAIVKGKGKMRRVASVTGKQVDADTNLITPAFHGDVDVVGPHQSVDPDVDLTLLPAAPSYDLVVVNNVAIRIRRLKLRCGALVDSPLRILRRISHSAANSLLSAVLGCLESGIPR
jgi:hypothetical protein